MAKRIELNETITFEVTLQEIEVRSERYCRVLLDRDIQRLPKEWQREVQERANELVAQHLRWETSKIDSYIDTDGQTVVVTQRIKARH